MYYSVVTCWISPFVNSGVSMSILSRLFFLFYFILWGWSGGAKKLGKLPVPGRPTYNSRAGAYCACSRCKWGLCGYFYSHLSFLSSVSLSLRDGPI